MSRKSSTGVGQLEPARQSVEQRHSQFRFQLQKLSIHSRRSDVQPPCSLTYRTGSSYRIEIDDHGRMEAVSAV